MGKTWKRRKKGSFNESQEEAVGGGSEASAVMRAGRSLICLRHDWLTPPPRSLWARMPSLPLPPLPALELRGFAGKRGLIGPRGPLSDGAQVLMRLFIAQRAAGVPHLWV
jgi:hypothetical protein